MGSATVRISNARNNYVPTASRSGAKVADQSRTVSNTAIAMLGTALDDNTKAVWWTLDGADARYTLDGSDPTSSNGHFAADGTSEIWHRDTAAAAKWIRDASTDANLHISEVTT